MDTPIIQGRGPKPAVPASAFDIPVLVRQETIGGRGQGSPRVNVQLRAAPSATFYDPDRDKVDLQCARGIGRLLHDHYQGHFWEVMVDSKQGIATITISVLLGNWKYLIKLDDLSPAMVITAGGEILERFNIPRSSIDVAAFVEARKRRVSRARQKPPTG